jgi:hypothetical protein
MIKLILALDMLIVGFFLAIVGLVHIPHKDIDPGLQPYYDHFAQLVQVTCPNAEPMRTPGRLILKFKEFDVEDPAVGKCGVFLNTAEIQIDSVYWHFANVDQRYQLVMHELTHCFFKSFILAKYPFHTSDEGHYMYYRMNDLTTAETQMQVIEVARTYCE